MSKKDSEEALFCKTCGHKVYDVEAHIQTEEHKRNVRKPEFIGRRTMGQCNTADFRYLEHLSSIIARGGEIDTSNLTSTQRMAVLVLRHFQENDVPFNVLLKIREVLIWDMNPGTAFEYKLLDPRDKETRDILRKITMGRRF